MTGERGINLEYGATGPKEGLTGRKRLSEVFSDPGMLQRLIPENFVDFASGEAVIIPTEEWIVRRLDDQWPAALGVLIVEVGGLDGEGDQEENEKDWGEFLNMRRNSAIRKGLISDKDKVLVSLIADDYWDANGVFVDRIALSSDLRGRGAGRSFYQNFSNVLGDLGYDFVSCYNSKGVIGFFRRMGHYRVDELSDDFTEYSKTGHIVNTVKFLNGAPERKCVKPEFLKPR